MQGFPQRAVVWVAERKELQRATHLPQEGADVLALVRKTLGKLRLHRLETVWEKERLPEHRAADLLKRIDSHELDVVVEIERVEHLALGVSARRGGVRGFMQGGFDVHRAALVGGRGTAKRGVAL